jgi:Protein of unknown function DUF2617
MPLHELAVSPADVTGSALRLALNAPAPRPLVGCRLTHPDAGVLNLGVLGASHVVHVEHANALCFSEQVSCTTHVESAQLPATANAPGYQLNSRIATHDEAAFRRLAHHLRDNCAQGPHWLGGAFPGDDAALTVLTGQADGLGWRWLTWHLYPALSGGVVVYTASRWYP